MKLTDAQRRALENLRAGRDACAGIRGMSASGGFVSTMSSLRRRGFIDPNDAITEAGRRALEGAR